jgi:hypothetical protein
MVRLPVTEGSAKVRSGPPIDDPDDLGLDVWAGVMPVRLAASAPETDGGLGDPSATPPPYVTGHALRR